MAVGRLVRVAQIWPLDLTLLALLASVLTHLSTDPSPGPVHRFT